MNRDRITHALAQGHDRPTHGQETELTAERARRRSRPFPSQPGPLNTPAGLKPMIDLMQRARDRETYGGAT